jgi:hypothetical protein
VRRKIIALVGASLLFASACSGDDDDSAGAVSGDDYGPELEASFLETCVPAAAGAPDPEGMCQCAYDKIVDTVPFAEFKAYDEALREDSTATPPDGLNAAVTECATAAVTTAP